MRVLTTTPETTAADNARHAISTEDLHRFGPRTGSAAEQDRSANPTADDTWAEFRRHMPICDRFHYLDHAAVGPLFGPAALAMQQFTLEASQSGDTVWPEWNQTLGRVRRCTAELIDADPSTIATIPNTTSGINLVAEGFPWKEGDNVVLPDGEFPSNLFPWLNQRSRGVEVRQVARRSGVVNVDDLMGQCDERTRIISVSWVGYATGFRVDIDQLVDRAHRRGILVLLDAIQGLGVYPISVRQTPVDFLVADGHKWLLGPEGFGVAMIAREHFDRLRPTNVGWASVRESHNYAEPTFELANAATRFESGSANMIAAAGLHQSLDYFNTIADRHGRSAMADRVIDAGDRLAESLRSAGATVRPRSNGQQRSTHGSGIVWFDVPGVPPAEVRRVALDAGVVLSCRGGGVRAAIHAYNNGDDIDAITSVVRKLSNSPGINQ